MKKKIVIKVYAQYTIFGTIDYMNGDRVFIRDSKETKPVKALTYEI